jgi:hypothetical protein
VVALEQVHRDLLDLVLDFLCHLVMAGDVVAFLVQFWEGFCGGGQ